MDKQKSEIISTYNPDKDYIKSNILVSSKYRSTLLENKLMCVCLSRIPASIEDSSGEIVVKVPGPELKKIFGLKDYGNLYKRLDETARKMTGRTVGYSNPELGEFEYMSVVTTAKFRDRTFECHFNSGMRKYLQSITSNFTRYNLDVMLSFNSVYALRLYEVLKSKAYVRKGQEYTNSFEFEFNLAELKLQLGVVNAELSEVKAVLNKSRKNPDYELACEKSPEKTYESWPDFKKRCLDVACREINENPKTHMEISYDTIKRGKGGKVYKVVFNVVLTANSSVEDVTVKKQELTEEQRADFYDEVAELIEEKIRLRDIMTIASASQYNIEMIREKYEIAKSQKIENLVAWMIAACQRDYSPAIKKEKANSFNNFKGRDYDYDGLMKEALGKAAM